MTETVTELQKKYEALYGEPPTPRYKNDVAWLEKKIAEKEVPPAPAAEPTAPVEPAAPTEEVVPAEETTAPAIGKSKKASVFIDGEYARTYSTEIHGDRFHEYAKEYASKKENATVELS